MAVEIAPAMGGEGFDEEAGGEFDEAMAENIHCILLANQCRVIRQVCGKSMSQKRCTLRRGSKQFSRLFQWHARGMRLLLLDRRLRQRDGFLQIDLTQWRVGRDERLEVFDRFVDDVGLQEH